MNIENKISENELQAQFAFVDSLAKWQAENGKLSTQQLDGVLLAWNLIHSDHEPMTMLPWLKMDYDINKHKIAQRLAVYGCDIQHPYFDLLHLVFAPYYSKQRGRPKSQRRLREIALYTITSADCSDADIDLMVKIVNSELECTQSNPITLDDVNVAKEFWRKQWEKCKDDTHQQHALKGNV